MVLYEKYGDDYEQIVAALPTEERRRLKREVMSNSKYDHIIPTGDT